VLCHNSVLKPKEQKKLEDLCVSKGVRPSVLGLGPIAQDLYHKYPGLARDFLGIQVDTGQIVSPEEFDNRGANIHEDLQVRFKRPGKNLLMVDDANRLRGSLTPCTFCLTKPRSERSRSLRLSGTMRWALLFKHRVL